MPRKSRRTYAVTTKTPYSPEDYLEIDRRSECKNEFLNGEIFAMGGATRAHNLITISLTSSLYGRLRDRPCEVYGGDMRVKVTASGMYTYPDVVVVCGTPVFEDKQLDTLTNPTVLIEILSDSTEGYDRGAKTAYYRRLDSLAEYLLIWRKEPHVEHFARQANNQWLLSESTDLGGNVELNSVNCKLALFDIYYKVNFESGETDDIAVASDQT